MPGSEKKTLTISAELFTKLSAMAGEAGADSVDELVSRIVRDWVSMQGAPKEAKPQQTMTPEDEKVVEERLKSLGYT